jgi:hypothetical protein
MATDYQKIRIPFAAAGSERPHATLLVQKLPSSSVSKTHECKRKSGAGTGMAWNPRHDWITGR